MKFIDKFGPVTEMRALSWKEPFASLMLHGKIETRTWDTKVRGWVLMCASLQHYTSKKLSEIAGMVQHQRIFNEIAGSNSNINMTVGNAFAVGRLTDSRLMTPFDEDKTFVKYKGAWFVEVKDKKAGLIKLVRKELWCHIYTDVHPIKPIPWKGAQGWRKLTQDFINSIELI